MDVRRGSMTEVEFPKLDPFKADIDTWLTEDKKAKRKQRHTAQRIYDRLVKEHKGNFTCSYRTVAGYVAKRKKEISARDPDISRWNTFRGKHRRILAMLKYYENGRLCSGKYLNLSFPYSNKGYFQVSKEKIRNVYSRVLFAIFEHIGGVPPKSGSIIPRPLSPRCSKEGERTLTDDFIRFSEHYRFEAIFCNVEARS